MSISLPPSETLEQRCERLDTLRLAQLPDEQVVATINQRRYLADLRFEENWKKKRQMGQRPLRWKRTK